MYLKLLLLFNKNKNMFLLQVSKLIKMRHTDTVFKKADH